jgi:mono/diheme cytochrome c family protein
MRPTALFLLVALSGPASAAPPSAEGVEYFEKNVRPLLVQHCQSCHGPQKQHGGFRIDTKADFLKGGDNGPVVVPGEPEKSPLIHAVRQDGTVKKMPPKSTLEAPAVAILTEWVKQGSPWPDGGPAAVARTVAEVREQHWSFRPVRKPAVPGVQDAAAVRTPVDAFILAELEKKGLRLSAAVDPRTLLRRVTFDLTGLPPTPEEVEAFLADRSADGYEKVVDRLLASPAYGERWGRHWLDVARYADTKGYVFTEERRFPYSYTYRDWVIRAFNEDLPYNQFVQQQLAADLLPHGDDNRSLAALGYLTLGRRFLNNNADIIDDRIDVVCRGLQGLTVSCARCHDHKFDPIPQKDYYSLYGIFDSCQEPAELPLFGQPEQTAAYQAFEKELTKRQEAVAKYREEHQAELKAKNRKFQDELKALEKKVEEWKVTAEGAPPRAMVLVDRPQPHNPYVFLRGNPGNHGPNVPRQYLEVVSRDRKPFTKGSGRLELAQAIASADNPLTARVLVNRVWLHHFGAGLVRTPSDFGLRGEPPTHPQLLDWLAATFVENGWSIKELHRTLVLSSGYRQSSVDRPEAAALDPENRLLWRMNRRRLEFEALRDSLLAVAGRLDTRMGGKGEEIAAPPFGKRRTVYGFIDRQNLPGLFRAFDLASPDSTSPQRFTTTVPQQALFLMNSPFPAEQARALVARPDVVAAKTDEERIDRLHRLTFGRPADPAEVKLGLEFLQAAQASQGKKEKGQLNAWEQYGQVLLLSNEFAFVD